MTTLEKHSLNPISGRAHSTKYKINAQISFNSTEIKHHPLDCLERAKKISFTARGLPREERMQSLLWQSKSSHTVSHVSQTKVAYNFQLVLINITNIHCLHCIKGPMSFFTLLHLKHSPCNHCILNSTWYSLTQQQIDRWMVRDVEWQEKKGG